jgi:tetratricopeptide (TPR) repeat protein
MAVIEALAGDGAYEQALALLRPLLTAAPDDPHLLCLASDLLSGQAEAMANGPSPEQGKGPAAEAVEHARRATGLIPQAADGWFELGRALGVLSQLPGGGETVAYARDSRAAFEQALVLEPDHVGALHGLGCWHAAVSGLSGLVRLAAKVLYGGLQPASYEEAARLFRRAIELDPEEIRHHLELGRTCLALKERDEARAAFERVLSLPARNRQDTLRQAEARELLAGISRQRNR